MDELKRKNLGWFSIHNVFVDYAIKEIGCTTACIYFSIARHRNQETGLSWPSQKLIAKELGISVRTVIRHISKLEEYKLITRTKETRGGHWEHYVYRLTDPKKDWYFTAPDDLTEPCDNMSSGDNESMFLHGNHTTEIAIPYDKADITPMTESHTKNTNDNKTKDINTNNTQKAELSGEERKRKFEEIRINLGIKKKNSTPP